MDKHLYKFLSSGLVVGLVLAIAGSQALAANDSLQMLPPTLLNSSTACQGSANNFLFFSGVSGKDSNGILSAINCDPNFKVDGSGNPNATTLITVGQNTNTNMVYINSNQVWNSAGNLYLNYSAPSSNVVIGGNNQYENLLVSKGEVQIPSSWGSLDFVHINGNQIYNSGGNLYLNANGPDGTSVVVGGGAATENLSVPKGSVCLNGSCISSWHSLHIDEVVATTTQALPGNNWVGTNSVTTDRTHDFCTLTANQHDGHDSNCEIYPQPDGRWTLQADNGIAGSGVWGTTNCQMTCFNFPGQ